jgi:hypothetical protein
MGTLAWTNVQAPNVFGAITGIIMMPLPCFKNTFAYLLLPMLAFAIHLFDSVHHITCCLFHCHCQQNDHLQVNVHLVIQYLKLFNQKVQILLISVIFKQSLWHRCFIINSWKCPSVAGGGGKGRISMKSLYKEGKAPLICVPRSPRSVFNEALMVLWFATHSTVLG